MSEERKKPGVGFWSAVVLIVLLAYPMSFGPACWISSRAERGGEILTVIYWPILKLMSLEKLSKICDRLGEDGCSWATDDSDSWETVGRGGIEGGTLNSGMFVWFAEIGAVEGAHWQYDVTYRQNRGDPVCITKEEWRWKQ